MKLFFITLMFTSLIFPQSDSIDCSKMYSNDEHIIIDKSPGIIGSFDSLYQNIIYPKEAIDNDIEGKVFVGIIIDKYGTPHCPIIFNSIGYGCDEEAIRVVMNSKFTPAYQNNKPVQLRVTIPIVFKLPK